MIYELIEYDTYSTNNVTNRCTRETSTYIVDLKG